MAVVHALARKSRNLNFGQERQQRIALLDPDFSRCRCRRRCRIVRSLISCFNRRCLWHCCRRLPVFGRRAVVTVSLVVLCIGFVCFALVCLLMSLLFIQLLFFVQGTSVSSPQHWKLSFVLKQNETRSTGTKTNPPRKKNARKARFSIDERTGYHL